MVSEPCLTYKLVQLKTIKMRKLSFNGNVFSYFSCISVNETNKHSKRGVKSLRWSKIDNLLPKKCM